MPGRGECLLSVLCASCRSSALHKTFPAINRTACCSKRGSSRFFLLLRDFALAWGAHHHRRAPACFFCNGSGFASTSNLEWQRLPAEIPSGATLQPWMSTIRTVPCPPGSAGTCSICRTGSTLQVSLRRLLSSWFWFGCYFCRDAGASHVSLL